ncbi:MAG: sulfatase modifying factor 1, partial [Planctomycetota bacterium]
GPDAQWGSNWSKDGSGGGLLQPVEQVSWEDCTQVAMRFGLNLPSEAQWEYGCRGRRASVYWSGDEVSSLLGVENLADGHAKRNGAASSWSFEPDFEDGFTIHAPVGSFLPNVFGLHDVHGNVREWCMDGYEQGFYGRSPSLDPLSPPEASADRVSRGGSFDYTARDARSANRDGYGPGNRYRYLGFRPSQDLSF